MAGYVCCDFVRLLGGKMSRVKVLLYFLLLVTPTPDLLAEQRGLFWGSFERFFPCSENRFFINNKIFP